MDQLLLGIDFGTGGCKVTIINHKGAFIADGFTEYATHYPHVGWSEQNPADWYPAFMQSFKAALQMGKVSASQVVGLSVDASAHNAVLLGANDQVLRPTIMWTDQRSTEESAYLLKHHGDDIFRIGYQMPSPTWTISQLLWVQKHDPSAFAQTKRIMFIKDYFRYLLTGEWTTDHIEAQGSLLFDNNTMTWSKELCAFGGIDMALLPPIIKPTDIAGKISKKAAEATGIPEGTPFVNGGSDTALENYCVGATREGCCVVKLATAGTVNVFKHIPQPNPKALTYSHVVDGLWYTCLATSSAAKSLRWYKETFCQVDADVNPDIYKLLDTEASLVAPGADGLIYHPYLTGERSPYWDAKLCASFTGIRAHHERGHFNRAIMEGVAFSLNDNLLIAKKIGHVEDIIAVGGGAKSPIWREILANVLNHPILKYAHDDSSFGSALLAGVGTKVFDSHEDAIQKSVHLIDRIEPNKNTAAVYQRSFDVYKRIQEVLQDVYHAN